MKGGNATTVAVVRLNYRRVRHCVDGSHKKQQACQTYEVLEFHGALVKKKAIARETIELPGDPSLLWHSCDSNWPRSPEVIPSPTDDLTVRISKLLDCAREVGLSETDFLRRHRLRFCFFRISAEATALPFSV